MPSKPRRGKITAILLSWKRTRNIPRIIEALSRSPRIGEILLWNNNPKAKLHYPRVVTINSPKNFLCFARYCLVPLAANDIIWFQDDDVLVEKDQLEAVYSAYMSDPSRIYGTVGRNIVGGRYCADNVHGECDIILGRTMLFHRALFHHAVEPLGAMPPAMTEDDIIFSLAAGRRHFAVDVHARDMGSADRVALWRRPGHFRRRQRAVDFMRAWQRRA